MVGRRRRLFRLLLRSLRGRQRGAARRPDPRLRVCDQGPVPQAAPLGVADLIRRPSRAPAGGHIGVGPISHQRKRARSLLMRETGVFQRSETWWKEVRLTTSSCKLASSKRRFPRSPHKHHRKIRTVSPYRRRPRPTSQSPGPRAAIADRSNACLVGAAHALDRLGALGMPVELDDQGPSVGLAQLFGDQPWLEAEDAEHVAAPTWRSSIGPHLGSCREKQQRVEAI